MHAVLITLIALAAGNDAPPAYHQASACGCVECVGGHASHKDVNRAMKAVHNMMPQTCYDPVYGCYRGSRFMHRYPAFHGTFYRRPYNYRNMFDYPWHAEPHEPTSMFSFDIADRRESAAPVPPSTAPTGQPPVTEPIDPPARQPAEAPTVQPTTAIEFAPIGTGVVEQASRRTEVRSSRRNANRFRR